MTDHLTKANINLFAILRNLEDLCAMEDETKLIVKDCNISIQFIVKNGPEAFLILKDGKCALQKGRKRCKIKLYFKNPEHLNKMFDGKANPILLKGFTKLGFLKKEFPKLVEKLTYYLKPTDQLLKDPKYLKINTYLTMFTAFNAMVQIANHDRLGKLNSSRIPDGVVAISILGGGPSIFITSKSGCLEINNETDKLIRAYMNFANLNITNAILNNKVDTYSAIGGGELEIKGCIPMIDNLNKLLSQVPAYVR